MADHEILIQQLNRHHATKQNEEGNRWLAAVRLNGSTPYQPAQEN
jgi:hypothetical protein